MRARDFSNKSMIGIRHCLQFYIQWLDQMLTNDCTMIEWLIDSDILQLSERDTDFYFCLPLLDKKLGRRDGPI